MKLRINSKGTVAMGAFKLTGAEIELQVLTDLTTYRKVFRERYGAAPAALLDVESLVKELWGVEVIYEDIPQPADEEILGYFAPEVRSIVVDPRICNHPRRVSFTVAHEAGHLSLHAFMFGPQKDAGATRTTRRKLKTSPSIEWQANIYASHLLAPKHELLAFLQGQELAVGNAISKAIDMEQVLAPLQEQFGLSRQAMEIHFRRLGIPMANARYPSD